MQNIVTFPSKPLGYEQLTVSTTAVPLASVPADAIRAVIGVEAQPMRYRNDETNPTASVGFLAKADATIELHSYKAIKNFKAIRSDATDSVLNVIYYG